MTFNLERAVMDANAEYFGGQSESVPLANDEIPVSIRSVFFSVCGWPIQRDEGGE